MKKIQFRSLSIGIGLLTLIAISVAAPLSPPSPGKQSGWLLSLYFSNIHKTTGANCGQTDSVIKKFWVLTSSTPMISECLLVTPFLTQYLSSRWITFDASGNTTIGGSLMVNGSMGVSQKITSANTVGTDHAKTVITKWYFVDTVADLKNSIPLCERGYILQSSGGKSYSCVETILAKGGTGSGTSFRESEQYSTIPCRRWKVVNIVLSDVTYDRYGTNKQDGKWTWICQGSWGGRDTHELTAVLKVDGWWDGVWGWWYEYGSCSNSCGNGTQTWKRTQTCDKPYPNNGGRSCDSSGIDYESRTCYDDSGCPPPPPPPPPTPVTP